MELFLSLTNWTGSAYPQFQQLSKKKNAKR